MTRHLAAVAVIVVCSMLAVQGCKQGKGAPREEADDTATPVIVEELGRTNLAEVLTYPADLMPYIDVKIFSPVPDRILYFPWKNGDEIKRGQRVALVRKEGLDKGLEQIVAQMEALDVQIQNLKAELERSKELLAAGVITRQVFDKVQTSYLSTIAQRKSLEASKGRMAVQAGNAVINAPISGVIADKMLERGDMAVPQVPLCRIIQVDRLKIHLDLVERDVPKVKKGQKVVIKPDCCPGRPVTGEISRIFPYLNQQTRTNTAEVIVENPVDERKGDRILKPGMYGRAELVVGERAKVLVAPERALLLDNTLLKKQKEGEKLRRAYVASEGGKAEERLVKVGSRKGSYLEILEGLAAGEKIIVRGHHGLKDEQKIKIVSTEK